jgi:AcrR family transcriptional regulator
MSLRAQKKAATLRAILDAAARLFAERGYAQTRTRDIAQAAGIATGTLFNYAPTKERVVLLLWRDRAERAVREGTLAAADLADPVEAMCAVFRPIFTFYEADRELGRIFLQQVMFDPGTEPEQRALNEGFIGALALRLQPHAGAEALSAAMNVFAAYLVVLTMLLADRLPSVDSAEHLFRDLLRTQARGWRALAVSAGGGESER